MATSKDLVESVYDDVDPKLHPIAIWSLETHLYKLLEDGVVKYDPTKKFGLINKFYVCFYFRLFVFEHSFNLFMVN